MQYEYENDILEDNDETECGESYNKTTNNEDCSFSSKCLKTFAACAVKLRSVRKRASRRQIQLFVSLESLFHLYVMDFSTAVLWPTHPIVRG